MACLLNNLRASKANSPALEGRLEPNLSFREGTFFRPVAKFERDRRGIGFKRALGAYEHVGLESLDVHFDC